MAVALGDVHEAAADDTEARASLAVNDHAFQPETGRPATVTHTDRRPLAPREREVLGMMDAAQVVHERQDALEEHEDIDREAMIRRLGRSLTMQPRNRDESGATRPDPHSTRRPNRKERKRVATRRGPRRSDHCRR